MRIPRISKKAVVLGATFGVVVAMTVTAAAYWTTGGNGTGSAGTGHATAFTIASTPDSDPALTPDATIGTGNIQNVAYTVTNPTGSGSQQLNQVVIEIATSTGGVWSSQTDAGKPACTKSDFSVGGEAIGTGHTDTSVAATLADGGTANGSVTVQMIATSANQDNCQGVIVPLYFTAS